MKILVYDCEIIKAIQADYKNEEKIEGIEYCNGWDDFENMGISVIGTYNNWDKESIAFVIDEVYNVINLPGFIIKPMKDFQLYLNITDVLVGFNNKRFDDELIIANGFTIPENIVNYDILQEIWRAVGLGDTFVYPTHAGFSLDQCCKVNGLDRKTGNGGNAAIMWQRGQYKEVIDYCLNDIKITTDLFRKIVNNDGWIENPKTKIKVRTIGE
jgi:hypothetical protein